MQSGILQFRDKLGAKVSHTLYRYFHLFVFNRKQAFFRCEIPQHSQQFTVRVLGNNILELCCLCNAQNFLDCFIAPKVACRVKANIT